MLPTTLWAASIVSVTGPDNGVYSASDNIEFTLEFDSNLVVQPGADNNTVTFPWLLLKLDSGLAVAQYNRIEASKNIVFSLPVNHNDFDFNGVEIIALDNNGATILTDQGLPVDLSLPSLPDLSNVKINHGNQTRIPQAGIYLAGEILEFSLAWGRVDELALSGTPQLTITVGNTVSTLDGVVGFDVDGRQNGSINFSYTVGENDFDADGISVDSFSVSGGSLNGRVYGLEDLAVSTHPLIFSNSNFSSTQKILVGAVDTPYIASVNVPESDTYNADSLLNFTLNFSEPVTDYLTNRSELHLTLDNGKVVVAKYLSGSTTSQHVYQYKVLPGDRSQGIQSLSFSYVSISDVDNTPLSSGKLRDIADMSGINVFGDYASVSEITLPFNTTYVTNDTLTFDISFDQIVSVNGLPKLELIIGGQKVQAIYVAGTGTNKLRFQYQIIEGLDDSNGIEVLGLNLFDSSITDANGNSADIALGNTGDTSGILIDGGAVVTSVQIPSAKTYFKDELLEFTVNFDESVEVTGIPVLTLALGHQSVSASYVSGSGASSLVFQYRVLASDQDTDGIRLSNLRTYAASIKNAQGLSAQLSLKNVPDSSGVLVDGGAPHGYSFAVDQASINASNVTAGSLSLSQAEIGATYFYQIGLKSGKGNVIKGSGVISDASQQISDINLSTLNDGLLQFSVYLVDGAGNQGSTLSAEVIKLTQAARVSTVEVPADATYPPTLTMNFVVNFNQAVILNGTPELNMTIGSTPVVATYQSVESSANRWLFNYTVLATDNDADGISVDSLRMNDGAVLDVLGNAVDLNLQNLPDTTGVLVTSQSEPYITFVNSNSTGSLVEGDTLSFSLAGLANASPYFKVTGIPQITLELDSGDVVANFTSISPFFSGFGQNPVFTYTVQAGDSHTSGTPIKFRSLDFNGGNILCFPGSNLNPVVGHLPGLSNIKIDTAAPQVVEVKATSGTYIKGDALNISVIFGKDVVISDTPQLDLQLGANSYSLPMISNTANTLVFSYLIQDGDKDPDGIEANTLTDNGGSILGTDGQVANLELTNQNLRGAVVDSAAPTGYQFVIDQSVINTKNQNNARITLSGAEIGSSYQLDVSHNAGGQGSVQVTGTVRSSTQVISGVDVSGIDDGELLYQFTLTDKAGLVGSTVTNTINKDTLVPQVSSVAVPANDIYILAETLAFNVIFDDVVNLNDTPQLSINVGGVTRQANYISGSGTNNLLFNYAVQAGEADLDGITISAVKLNNATIEDASGNDVNLTLNNVAATSAVLVDAVVPVVTSVAVPVNDTYILTETLIFSVNFDDQVQLSGNPQLSINIGTMNRLATYIPGGNSAVLNFQYQIVAGDLDTNGIEINALELNDSTLLDVSGNLVDRSLNNIAPTSSVLVDGVAPVISRVTVPQAKTYVAGEQLLFTLVINDQITVKDLPQLNLKLGDRDLAMNYVPDGSANELRFAYTVMPGDLDLNGVELGALNLANATLSDASGNGLNPVLNNVGSTSGVLVDALAPANYSVAFDLVEINAVSETNISFTMSSAEVGSTYHYEILSDANNTKVMGQGSVTSATQVISNINISSLLDGQLVLSLNLADAQDNHGDVVTAQAQKINDAPVFNVLPRIVGNAAYRQTLNVIVTNVTDPEADGIDLSYQWLANGNVITDAKASSFTLNGNQAGQSISVQVTASDGRASSVAVSTGIQTNPQPLILVADDVTVDATGLFTQVELGNTQAFDQFGNSLQVTQLQAQEHFAPGAHQVTWQAIDALGNQAQVKQNVFVNPLISFSGDQVVTEGNRVTFDLLLNGQAPVYPLVINYEVAGSADGNDHDLVSGQLTFLQDQLKASLSFNILNDSESEVDENIRLSFSDADINAGTRDQLNILIKEENLPPVINLQVQQENIQRMVVGQSAGDVIITAEHFDPNESDIISFEWMLDELMVDLDEQENTFTFDPSLLKPGTYKLSAKVQDSGEPSLFSQAHLYIQVLENLPQLGNEDSDGDGVSDIAEGFSDADGDGIADYLDAISATNLQPVNAANSQTHIMECEVGLICRPGDWAIADGTMGVGVNTDQLDSIPVDTSFNNVGGLYSFEVSGLSENGATVLVVIPQLKAIPAEAVYRKINGQGEWQDFIEDGNNQLASVPGAAGYCPPPGSDLWQPGLTEGHWCVQLSIQDGGANDLDGLANGFVQDPGGVAQRKGVQQFTSDSGGSINLMVFCWFILLLMWRGKSMGLPVVTSRNFN